MKSLYSLALLAWFIVFSSCKKADVVNETDKVDILKETEKFIEAWNSGDTKLCASFYAEDGVRVGAEGDLNRGRQQIEAAYDYVLNKINPGAIAKAAKGTVRLLTSEYALWQTSYTIEKPGDSLRLAGHVVEVLQKVNGRWMILEAHPKIFPRKD
jgi:uncharacterized protein (TIGR02246 family)